MQAFLFIIFNRIELDESRINSRLHIDKYLLHILCITAIQVLRTKDWFRYDATHSSNTHVAKSIYLTNMSTALMDIDSIAGQFEVSSSIAGSTGYLKCYFCHRKLQKLV